MTMKKCIEKFTRVCDILPNVGTIESASLQLDTVGAHTFALHAHEMEELTSRVVEVEGNAACAYLAMGLKKCPKVEKVVLFGMSGSGMKMVSRAWKDMKALWWLSLGECNIGENEAADIASGVQACGQLRYLSLSENNINDNEGAIIAKGMVGHPSLCTLDLSYNSIGDDTAAAVGHVLVDNAVLRCVNLGWNGIEAEGAKAVARGLSQNKTLIEFYIETNQGIGDIGVKALMESVMVHPALTTIVMTQTGWSDEAADAVATMIEVNTSVASFFMGYSMVSDIGGERIAKALAKNNTMTYVWMNHNNMSRAKIHKVEAAVSDTLDVWRQRVAEKDTKAATEAMWKLSQTFDVQNQDHWLSRAVAGGHDLACEKVNLGW